MIAREAGASEYGVFAAQFSDQIEGGLESIEDHSISVFPQVLAAERAEDECGPWRCRSQKRAGVDVL